MNKILRRYDDEFLKFHGPSVRRDWQQVRAFDRLTSNLPRVRTAKPLRAEFEEQRIWYEWLGKLSPLMSLRGEKLDDAVWRVGKALAGVHEGTAGLPHDARPGFGKILLLEEFGIDASETAAIDARVPVGFFHGDCWHGNVLVDTNHDLVLIDPIQSPWLFGRERFDLASGVADLATMHMSFLVSVKLMQLLRLDVERRLELGDLLLDSYLSEFDATAVRGYVLRLSRAIATKYISTYPVRVNALVGRVKLLLSRRVMADAAVKGFG